MPRKLGIAARSRVAIVDAPTGFEAALSLPEGARVLRRPGAGMDVIVAFCHDRAALARRLPALARRLDPAGGLWIAWPKRASGVATDLTEDVVREAGLAAGLVDNKVCAIDEIWSGLRLVRRLADRPAR